MARQWIVRPSAEADLEDATLWYEQQRTGLGLRFLDAVDGLFHRIRAMPLQFPIVSADVRRALMQTFPYAVYFRATHEAVIVFAVLHLHRDPETWRDRPIPSGN